MNARFLGIAIALALGACGSPTPAAAPPEAIAPAPTPTLPALPFVLGEGSARPLAGTSEGLLVERWVSILGGELGTWHGDLRVDRTELALLGEGNVLSFQGLDRNAPPSPEALLDGLMTRVEHVWVEDGRAGRRIVVRLVPSGDEGALLGALDPSTAPRGLQPWLIGAFACDDATLRTSPTPDETLAARCEDLAPRIGAELVARSSVDDDATELFLRELFRLYDSSVAIDLERDADELAGEVVRGASFVPFAATLADATLNATGTVHVARACATTLDHARFVLRAGRTSLSLEREVIATERVSARCR
jgi:hypothetical protein